MNQRLFIIPMDNFLKKLKEQEERLVKEQQRHAHKGRIKLSPTIDIEKCLRNGYIAAEDYEKTHR